jgi:hypothetical protein
MTWKNRPSTIISIEFGLFSFGSVFKKKEM